MKRYWDTSALIGILESPRLRDLSMEPDQWTRPHSLAEMFSTLTGGRLGFRLSPKDAAEAVREIAGGMNFVELKPKEIFSALDKAQMKGVRGGNIHDWLHAVAAQKAKVKVLLTYNLPHFENLSGDFKIEAP